MYGVARMLQAIMAAIAIYWRGSAVWLSNTADRLKLEFGSVGLVFLDVVRSKEWLERSEKQPPLDNGRKRPAGIEASSAPAAKLMAIQGDRTGDSNSEWQDETVKVWAALLLLVEKDNETYY